MSAAEQTNSISSSYVGIQGAEPQVRDERPVYEPSTEDKQVSMIAIEAIMHGPALQEPYERLRVTTKSFYIQFANIH